VEWAKGAGLPGAGNTPIWYKQEWREKRFKITRGGHYEKGLNVIRKGGLPAETKRPPKEEKSLERVRLTGGEKWVKPIYTRMGGRMERVRINKGGGTP